MFQCSATFDGAGQKSFQIPGRIDIQSDALVVKGTNRQPLRRNLAQMVTEAVVTAAQLTMSGGARSNHWSLVDHAKDQQCKRGDLSGWRWTQIVQCLALRTAGMSPVTSDPFIPGFSGWCARNRLRRSLALSVFPQYSPSNASAICATLSSPVTTTVSNNPRAP